MEVKKAARKYVEISATWGNADADSSIKVSQRRWQEIRAGANFEKTTWAWYEGKRFVVAWSFSEGRVTIDSDDGQCLVDFPVGKLFVNLPQ